MSEDTLTPDMLGLENTSDQANEGALVDESTPEEGASQESTGTGESQYYSAEEFRRLLKNPLHMDVNRIPEEYKHVYDMAVDTYRDLKADYTRKTQQLAEQMRQLEKPQPKNVYEAYMQDPEGVISYIDAQTETKISEGDYDSALRLMQIKTNLIERRSKEASAQNAIARMSENIWRGVRAAIPDFDNKKEALTNFAIKEFGFTEQEISVLTNPAITGDLAGKLTLAINKAYQIMNAKNTANNKIKKPEPIQLGSSTGVSVKGGAKSIEELFYGKQGRGG